MNIGIQLNNAADKATQKTTSDLYVNHSKQYGKSGNPSVGATMGADSFTGLPNIESYNNYSKAGVFGNKAAVKQAAHTVSADVSETGSILDRFCLSDIPKWDGQPCLVQQLPVSWENVPLRGMSPFSKSEIRELLRALADKFVNTTCEREKDSIHSRVRTLGFWYISHGAPENRKAQFEQAMRKITRDAGRGGGTDFEFNTPKKLMDYLFKREDSDQEANRLRNGMMSCREYALPGGGTISGNWFGTRSGMTFHVNYPDGSGMRINVMNGGGFGRVGQIQFGSERELQLNREFLNYWDTARGRPPRWDD